MNDTNPAPLFEKRPVTESLFMPLYLKAVETQGKNPLMMDPKAVEIINSIDFDFSYIKKNKAAQYHVAARTKILDKQITAFINEAKSPVVVNLGSGLDTRYTRLNPQKVKRWYDIDFPEVIEYRNQFFDCTNSCKTIGKSVLDFSWVNDIERDKTDSVLFVAEGLLMYLKESDVKDIFTNIFKNFPEAHILCEVFNPILAKFHLKNKKNNKDLSFTWTVSNINEIESMHPSIVIDDVWVVFTYYREKQRLFLRVMSKIDPNVRNMVKIVKIGFKD